MIWISKLYYTVTNFFATVSLLEKKKTSIVCRKNYTLEKQNINVMSLWKCHKVSVHFVP